MKLMKEQTHSSFTSDHQRCQSSTGALLTMVTLLMFDAQRLTFQVLWQVLPPDGVSQQKNIFLTGMINATFKPCIVRCIVLNYSFVNIYAMVQTLQQQAPTKRAKLQDHQMSNNIVQTATLQYVVCVSIKLCLMPPIEQKLQANFFRRDCFPQSNQKTNKLNHSLIHICDFGFKCKNVQNYRSNSSDDKQPMKIVLSILLVNNNVDAHRPTRLRMCNWFK